MSLAEPASLSSTKELGENDSVGTSTPRASEVATPDTSDKNDTKGKKRALFGFGKKNTPESSRQESSAKATPNVSRNTSKLSTDPASQTSQDQSFIIPPSSPIRNMSTSPRLSSPARSQIFERDVQDDSIIKPNSPAIPTHIQTENYIPPVLDDASEAITNRKLDPDAVEIVTHNSHQPASVTVTGAGATGGTTPYDQTSTEWAAELESFADRVGLSGDTASNYGSLDSADVRRLSFISFADVVQAEQSPAVGSPVRDNLHMAGLTSIPSAAMNRSPSPMRSPVSSQGLGTSPPTSNPGSIKGIEMSPSRKPIGSPGSGQHSLTTPNDLNIETMRQALRRTGSTELGPNRSMPVSPIDGPGSR